MRLAHAIHLNHGDLLLPNRILRAALGGLIGRLADATALQKRILNASRGPAVWALRAQFDKRAYARQMLQLLRHTPNLHLREAKAAASRDRRGALPQASKRRCRAIAAPWRSTTAPISNSSRCCRSRAAA